MPKIFISYRRADGGYAVTSIYDALSESFGKESVFRDIHIPPGLDYREIIRQRVNECDVLLAIIGDRWLAIEDEDTGQPRLQSSTDWVRFEIETALKANKRVIPILVQGAQVPAADDLPDGIKDLSYRTAMMIRKDYDFNNDVNRLKSTLAELDAVESQGNPATHYALEVSTTEDPIAATQNGERAARRVVFRSYPILTFTWPTVLASLHCAAGVYFSPQSSTVIAGIFLIVLLCNLIALGSNAKIAHAIAWLVLAIAVVSFSMLLIGIMPGTIHEFATEWKLDVSFQFYLTYFVANTLLLIGSLFASRTDYWELRGNNELLHYWGFLMNCTRYKLNDEFRIYSEVPDVFRYLLMRAGKIILVIPGRPVPAVLDNVLFAQKLVAYFDRILPNQLIRLESGDDLELIKQPKTIGGGNGES